MMTLKHLLSFCISIICLIPVNAQWKELGVPYGFTVISSYIDEQGNLLIETADANYYSDDLGVKWTKCANYFSDLNNVIEFNYELYFRANYSIFKFDRINKIWDEVFKSESSKFNMDSRGLIWVAKDSLGIKSISLTKDFGKSFQYFDLPVGTDYCSEVFVQSFNDSLFLINIICNDKCRMYRFNDKATFTFLHELPKTYPLFYITPGTGTVYNYGFNNTWLRSTDQGKTYTIPNWPDGTYYGGPPNLRVLKNGFIIDKGGANFGYISEDDGKNWKYFESYLEPDVLYDFNYVNSTGLKNWSDTLIVIEEDCILAGVYTSFNKGATFNFKNDNLIEPKIKWIYEDLSGNLYMSTCSSNSLFKSIDMGKSWVLNPINFNGYDLDIRSMTEDEFGNIYIISFNRIFKSTDKGVSFNEIQIPPDKNDIWGFQNIIVKGNSIFLLGQFTGIISLDKGQSWLDMNTKNIHSKVFIDADYNMIFLDKTDNVLKYTPLTGQYDTLYHGQQFEFDIWEISKNGTIYFYKEDKQAYTFDLWISKDNMKSYEKLPNAPGSIKSIFTDNSNNIYLVVKSSFGNIASIYKSKDEGDTFSKLTDLPKGIIESVYLSQLENLYSFKNSPAELYLFGNNVSTTNLTNKLQFTYYPNPTIGELNIQLLGESRSFTLKLIDVLGKEKQQLKLEGNFNKLQFIPSISPGLYFIEIKDNEGRYGYGKFIKQ